VKKKHGEMKHANFEGEGRGEGYHAGKNSGKVRRASKWGLCKTTRHPIHKLFSAPKFDNLVERSWATLARGLYICKRQKCGVRGGRAESKADEVCSNDSIGQGQ
jgi:hypothetical protein